jgi:Tol biopolymer transport system component
MTLEEFEAKLGLLTPAPAPDRILEGARRGETAPYAPKRRFDVPLALAAAGLLAGLVWLLAAPAEDPVLAGQELAIELKGVRHRIVCESNRDGNWELYAMNADGANPVNLTVTGEVDELYPKVSPDGTKIVFVADEKRGDSKVRNLYLMNVDGSGRRKIADNSREPCWKADSAAVAYLPAEFEAHNMADFVTKGLRIYDLKSGQTREHPNAKIHHLYTLNWTPDGKWFVSTVHGGMGFKHNILALEAEGEGVFDLGLSGCRPDVSPDGKRLAWGHGDYAVGVADVDFSVSPPKVSNIHDVMESKDPFETYHCDWSPDGKYIAFSYGPKKKGKNIKGLLPEFPGVDAPDWNVAVCDANGTSKFTLITKDGKSFKEPDWIFVGDSK